MDLSATTEAELLALMAEGPYRSPAAKAALGELYSRHAGYLFSVVRRTFGSVLDEDDIVDVVNDAFLRAEGWAFRQQRPNEVTTRFSASTPDGIRRLVLGWLGTIAERLVMSKLSDRAVSASKLALYLEHCAVTREDGSEPTEPSPQPELREALSALSPEEREALTVSLPWYDVATSQFELPRGEAATISRHLGISTDLLRQRRYRALQHLREHFRQSGVSPDAAGGIP